MECIFCGDQLDELSPDELPSQDRIAFDANLGRLWQVCPHCRRWNPYPLDARWEMLEQCERWARDTGKLLLKTEHLTLLDVDDTQLIRVGRPPRIEFADWRYSNRLDAFPIRPPGVFERLLLALPERPVEGYTLQGATGPLPTVWAGGAFIEHGSLLSGLFAEVPFAETCPACGDPLILHPANFSHVQLLRNTAGFGVSAQCALCAETVVVAAVDARVALRVGLAIVSRRHRKPKEIIGAAQRVEDSGTCMAFIDQIAQQQLPLGQLNARERLALWLSLDEWAEADALEAEWKTAEEIAAISDGELTNVKGFQEFRARVLADAGND